MSKKIKPAPRSAEKSAKKAVPPATPSNNSWMAILPVALAVLVYFSGLRNEMTGLDDHTATTDNPIVKDFSLGALLTHFNLGMYAPLSWMGYALAFALGKANPFWYHLLSLLAHAFNTHLVYRLFQKLDDRRWLASVVALLFAIHPIQVESVSWIAGFSTPLFSMFCLLSWNVYLRYAGQNTVNWRLYGLALLFFVLACLAKSTAVTLPLTLLVLDWWRRPSVPARQRWMLYAPFFAIALGFGLLTFYSRQAAGVLVGVDSQAHPWTDRIWLVSNTLLFYGWKILFPYPLSVFYSLNKVNGAFPAHFYAAPVVLAAIGYAAWRWRHSHPFLWRGLLFYLSNILLSLPFYTVGTFELMSDHYNYLAVAGIFYLLVESTLYLTKRFPGLSAGLYGLATIWMLALLVLSFRQVGIWKNTITVLTNAIDNGYHYNGKAYFSRGVEHGDLQQFDQSIADFSKAIEVNPNDMDAYRFRGSLYAQRQQMPEALADLRKYVQSDTTNAVTWFNLGMIYNQIGKPNEALDAFNRTIALKPKSFSAYQGRAAAYEMLGDTARANADKRMVLQLRR